MAMARLYNVTDVAQKYGCTPRNVRHLQKRAGVEGKKIQGQWWFTADEVKRMKPPPRGRPPKKKGPIDA